MSSSKGLVIVYTGDGKGKTTAALGLALRASGYSKKILIIQFGKAWVTGEIEGIKKLGPNIKIIQGGKGFVKILGDRLPLQEHRKTAKKTFELLSEEIKSGKWDLIIADEIVGAVAGKLVNLQDLLGLIAQKPEALDLVLTGRYAHKKLIKVADLVTEMVKIKHPYDQGITAKRGIDY